MSERDRELPEDRTRAFAELDRALRGLPRIEPSPGFEARFRARLARAEEEASVSRWRGVWARARASGQLEWLAPAAAMVALAVLASRGDSSLPAADAVLLGDADGFELVLAADPELFEVLDALDGDAGDVAGTL